MGYRPSGKRTQQQKGVKDDFFRPLCRFFRISRQTLNEISYLADTTFRRWQPQVYTRGSRGVVLPSMSFADYLLRSRQSCAQVARWLTDQGFKTSRAAVSRWQRGETAPTADRLGALDLLSGGLLTARSFGAVARSPKGGRS